MTAPVASAGGARILAAARTCRPAIEAAADEIEVGRRLPASVVQMLKDAGVFRMTMPREWGGAELTPLEQLAVVEELSIANASVGWCAMIGSDAGYYTAFLDQAVARAMYPDIDAPTAGFIAPAGRALAVEGGYKVSGQWPMGSGCQHSAWLASGCTVFDGNAPRMAANGMPEWRVCFLPVESADILDTWTTTGLRGSGSHDYRATDVFVPSQHTFNFVTSPSQRPAPLYQFPALFLSNFAGVALGTGRAAIDAVRAIGAQKRSLARPGIQDEAFVQSALAQAEAMVGSARSYLVECTADLWAALVAGNSPDLGQRARYRLGMTNAHDACGRAVDLMYRVAGGGSVFSSSPLDRLLRDMHTINQHTVISLKSYEMIGQMLFGTTPAAPLY